jgi:hypothetical protein
MWNSLHSIGEPNANALEYVRVVERQFGQVVDRKPLDRGRIVAGLWFQLVRPNASQVPDGNRPIAWIASRVAECVKLLKNQLIDADFL